ncbi:ABC transporter permease [Mesorhizobium sp. M0955]|uniref:ABC transporter permease n=1 Tax=Mesorhizobium sp. M0955 TaxID=2957033 RepID=UPI00333B1E10
MSTTASAVIKRAILSLVTLVIVTIVISIGVNALPGDVAQTVLGQAATPETVEAFRRELGLDLPLYMRYFQWLHGVLTGDFGRSLANGQDVIHLIGPRFYNTLFLFVATALVCIPISLALGILSAIYRNTVFDKIISAVALTGISFPDFFVAYIFIVVFSYQLGLFPSIADVDGNSGIMGRLYASALPILTLSLAVMAHIIRMTRAAIVNVLTNPYIEMARLKGVRPRKIITRHALPNAMGPIVNVVVLNLAHLIVGTVVIEVVFAYPGLAQMLIDSVSKRDFPVIQASCLIFAVAYILMNMIADMIAVASNPRLRTEN